MIFFNKMSLIEIFIINSLYCEKREDASKKHYTFIH